MKKFVCFILATLMMYLFTACGGASTGVTENVSQSEPEPEVTLSVEELEEMWQIGKYVTFGNYQQTTDEGDKAPIEWLVLDRDGNRALLISRYGLDAVQYNKDYADVTWEDCTLRFWLNDSFIKNAFTAEEQEAILITEVDNSSSQCYSGWNSEGGNNTLDQIFCLSFREATYYFDVTEEGGTRDARIKPTEYALARVEETLHTNFNAWYTEDSWWLRSPGRNQCDAIYISEFGSFRDDVNNSVGICVRPAFWVDLETATYKGAEAVDEPVVPYENWQPGEYITFGSYSQTEAGTDSTPIEWLVLDRNGNNVLLISRYALDVVPYNEEKTDMTWEECTLRTWLNNDFINKAFTAEQQSSIMTTWVDNGYSRRDTYSGNNTEDKVFILSYPEAYRYFDVTQQYGSKEARTAPTEYALGLGARTYTTDDVTFCCWWLRSPAGFQYGAAYVNASGTARDESVNRNDICVRPALWLDLESGNF